jgi:predicted nucleotidyltransferase
MKAFVIGAAARDLIFEYVYDARIQRATEDLDFGVAVETWADYDSLKTQLIGSKKFKKDPQQEQRILWTEKVEQEIPIDLVPYGGLETGESTIAFPPSEDFTMSTLGFLEVSQNLLTLEISKGFSVELASPAGVALLKFVAYNDRPAQRRRDIQDIFYIAENYLAAGNEDRLYDPQSGDTGLLEDENFDYRTAGARLLGRDIVPLLNKKTKSLVSRILDENPSSGSMDQLIDIVNQNRFRDTDGDELARSIFHELAHGISDVVA